MAVFKLIFLVVLASIALQAAEGKKCFKQICKSYKTNTLRGCDKQGCGHFNARRGRRLHKGIDLRCDANDDVYAPFPAKFLRRTRPYGTKHKHFKAAFNTGMFISGTGGWKKFRAKIFYVSKSSGGGTYKAGQTMGTYKKLPYAGIRQHVHITLYKKTKGKYRIVNPKPYIC